MEHGTAMHLLLIRHAIAEERLDFARTGQSDYYRPLTERGRSRMSRGAAGLSAIVPEIDVLASSPLTRAVQTAEIVAEAYDGLPVERVDSLGSGDGPEFLEWLRDCPPESVVAAVGHEPTMSDWTAWLLTGGFGDLAVVKKGSAIMLEFPYRIDAGEAWLRWFLTPAQLRQLGR